MKLLNDFFKITDIQADNDEIRCVVKLNAEHVIYQAHFPGNPITPGMLLLQIATEILQLYLSKSNVNDIAVHLFDDFVKAHTPQLSLQTVVNMKFRKPVEPGSSPVFIFRKMKTDGNALSVSISIDDNETQLVKMSLVYHIINNS